jgi:hypothetical protein
LKSMNYIENVLRRPRPLHAAATPYHYHDVGYMIDVDLDNGHRQSWTRSAGCIDTRPARL